MKKILFLTLLSSCLIINANAQIEGSALGLRFNHSQAEFSYQHQLTNTHRIEADLGYNTRGAVLSGIYHWVWDLSRLNDGFNLYAGPGISVGLLSDGLKAGIVGQLGLEYNFSFPLQLSIDYRPAFFIPVEWQYDGICLSARYKF